LLSASQFEVIVSAGQRRGPAGAGKQTSLARQHIVVPLVATPVVIKPFVDCGPVHPLIKVRLKTMAMAGGIWLGITAILQFQNKHQLHSI
jgi:hypothetical protein